MELFSRIKRARPPGSMIAAALALVALFVALGGGAWALTTKGKTVQRASTITLTGSPNTPPGGTPASAELFRLGDVSVDGACSVDPDGNVSHFVGVTNHATHSVLLAPSGSPSEELAPNDSEAVIADGTTGGTGGSPSARQTSFAIIDKGGVSATVLAAASGHPASGDCVITAQAAG